MMVKHENKDLSPTAIKKAVLSHSLQRPLTVYPATVGALGGFYALLFGANPIALGALIAGAGITLVNWLVEYFFRGDHHASHYVELFRKELERRRIETLQLLETELKDIDNDQAVTQVNLFRKKYANFQSILQRKFAPEEITYNRYLGIAEQVFLNGLDNLENAAIALKSISAIDHQRISRELQQLEQAPSEENRSQKNELITRLELRSSQLQRVNDLLMNNEQALTQLDQVAARLANIDTRQNRAQLDMEDAMQELRRLIARTDHYSND